MKVNNIQVNSRYNNVDKLKYKYNNAKPNITHLKLTYTKTIKNLKCPKTFHLH